jgi:hypothetical protein
MSKKALDITFVHYGITKEDMQIIENICKEHSINFEWVKDDILKKFHENKINDIEITEKSMKRIIEKALQKVS